MSEVSWEGSMGPCGGEPTSRGLSMGWGGGPVTANACNCESSKIYYPEESGKKNRCKECGWWATATFTDGYASVNASQGYPCDTWPYRTRKLASPLLRSLKPGCGCCYRCKIPWAMIESHSTPYRKGSACFPLCELCWRVLSPKARVPFYRMLYDEWEAEDERLEKEGHDVTMFDDTNSWDAMREAVLLEGALY